MHDDDRAITACGSPLGTTYRSEDCRKEDSSQPIVHTHRHTHRRTRAYVLCADGHLMLHLVALISLGAPMKTRLPMLSPLPPVLSPADGVHTFTYDSVQRRLPLIVEAVISNNPDYKPELIASLRSLAAEIATGAPLKPLLSTRSGWPEMLAPLLEEGATWFSAPWWIAENYFCAWTFLEF